MLQGYPGKAAAARQRGRRAATADGISVRRAVPRLWAEPVSEQLLHSLLKSGGEGNNNVGGTSSASTSAMTLMEEVYRLFFARSALHARLCVSLDILAKFGSKLLVVGNRLIAQLAELPERYGELSLKCTLSENTGATWTATRCRLVGSGLSC